MEIQKKIEKRYFLFIATIVVCVIIVIAIFQSYVEEQKRIVNFTEALELQMLTCRNVVNKIHFISDNYSNASDYKRLEDFKSYSNGFISSHKSIYKKIVLENENSSSKNRFYIDSIFSISNSSIEKINTISNALVKGQQNLPNIDNKFHEAEATYLHAMNTLLIHQQNVIKTRLDDLKKVIVIVAILFGLFVLGGFFIILIPVFDNLLSSNKVLTDLKSSLLAKEKYNRIFIEQSPSSMAMLDNDMKYIAASEKWKEDYKITDKHIIGKSHYDIFPEITDDWKALHQKCLKGEIDICDEAPFIRKDGTVQWLSWDVRPWYLSENEIGGLLMYSRDITKLKNDEIAKLRVEQILESTTKVARIGAWEVDMKTDKMFFSDISKEILKLPEDYEVYSKKSLHFYNTEVSRTQIVNAIQRLIKTGEPFDLELEIMDMDGEEKWIRDIGQAEFVNGECIRLYGVFQDITVLKKSENALKKQNQLLNFAEEMNVTGHWQWNVKANSVKWSSNLYKIVDMDEATANVTPETFFEITHPDDFEMVSKHFESKFMDNKFNQDIIYRIITAKGKVKIIQVLSKLFKDSSGEIIEIIGTFQDITHQRTAEIKFRGLLESAPDAMVIINKDSIVHLSNKQAERIFGYSSTELLGQPISVLVPKSVQANLEAIQKQFIDNPEELRLSEVKELIGVNKDGREFPINISLSPLQTEDGLLISIAIRDITNEKEYEDKILKSNKNLELTALKLTNQNVQLADFAQITSHNLRAPVSNLNSLIDMYQMSTEEGEKAMVFEKFEKVVIHLTNTLNNLIDALKIKNKVVEKQNISLTSAFKHAEAKLAPQIIESNARITSDFSAIDEIFFNKTYIESIFLNLLENSIKYKSNDRTPEIHVKSYTIDGKIKLEITDNGLGINLKRHGKKLFGLNKVFHRHPDAKGVGLFMTKMQIESMGGSIKAESIVDQGTKFIINFN
ncbi:PAS domain-containing sensor histidine kinase [Winogradskyella endarachnes]|nr:PAS domain S-box protein [Winogradskyella endarachnes]